MTPTTPWIFLRRCVIFEWPTTTLWWCRPICSFQMVILRVCDLLFVWEPRYHTELRNTLQTYITRSFAKKSRRFYFYQRTSHRNNRVTSENEKKLPDFSMTNQQKYLIIQWRSMGVLSWYDDMIDMRWYDMIWYEMIWCEMIWDDMRWYDMRWYYMKWYDMIDMIYDLWYYIVWYDIICTISYDMM